MASKPSQQNLTLIISKTETEYNMKSIRFLLLTITSMFIVIGILMMLLGISVYAHYHSFTFVYDAAKAGSFFAPSVMCVFLGFLLLIISSFGFFGSLKQSTCAVNLYALILMGMLVLKLVLVILAFTMDPDTIASHLSIPVNRYATDPEVEAEIDSLQLNLGCCGGVSYLDYMNVEFGNHTTFSYSEEVEGGMVNTVVPWSCCMATDDKACTRLRGAGCQRVLVHTIVQNGSVLGVLGVSVMFIELLGIIFALLLARCIRKLKSQRALMAWRIREQLIMAREDEDKHQSTMYITPQESSVA